MRFANRTRVTCTYAYFYLDFNDADKGMVNEMLPSIIQQSLYLKKSTDFINNAAREHANPAGEPLWRP